MRGEDAGTLWWTLFLEALFAAVFVRVLVGYLRRRDGLQRDVVLMFSALAVLFVLAVLRQVVGEPPRLVTVAASVLLLGQPFLTLRVVRRVARVPAAVYWPALVGWVASGVLLAAGGEVLGRRSVLAVVAVFVVTEIAAAVFLARLALGRTGAARTRLWLAAGATALFAVAILLAGAGAGGPEAAQLARQAGRLISLVSALGYLLAFAPPAWARRAWSTRAAYDVVRQLLQGPPDAAAPEIWQRYATAVCRATSSGSAVVLTCTGEDTVTEIARVGVPAPPFGAAAAGRTQMPTFSGSISVDDPRQTVPPVVLDYASAGGFRFVTAAPLSLSSGPAVLLLFGAYRSLFTDDDVQLLGELAPQAAALGQRADLLTDRDRLTGELSDSVAALTKASRAKSDFMANMSHELRTPLNAIIGFSDLMRSEPAADGQTSVPTEWIGHIYSSGQHLLNLINEVLDLAKVESGNVDLRCQPVDLREAIGEVVTSLAALSQRKDLDVTVAVAPLRVHADRTRLRQIVTNLLSNAIKFTPEGGQIFLAARRVGHDIAISVADTGPGISTADQQRVFEEFQQFGDQHSRAGGTGLGLALTRRLVHAHGGRIDLQSEPGHGAKFIVYLPAADTPTDRSPTDDDTAPPTSGARGGVLIIEDDPAAARLLSAQLQRAGYHVTVAATGEQGLAAARAGDPEAVLLDIDLPGIDGWQVLAALKRDERLRHIPVLIVSAHDDSEIGLALGAVDYFVKPVDRSTLLTWLAGHGLIPATNGRQLSVLAIDDDPASRELIDATLSAEGIQVVTATGGVDGLKTARARRFDLIICDLLMPDLDGFDVIAALHNDPATHGVPVVVLSAHTLTEADKARLSGKVIAVAGKTANADGLAELAHTIGELTGLTLTSDTASA
ncbi:response regulator [Actinoplanes sp. NPDC051475]|uniref:response regulator n=1 Tax=Actinoplanes sp. NPDC051475 TaxID=3157225 RepID=UPI00344E9550